VGEGRGLAVPRLRRGSLEEEGQQVVLQHRGCGGRPLAVGWEEKRGGSAGGKPGEGRNDRKEFAHGQKAFVGNPKL